jgi:hypothetical protein
MFLASGKSGTNSAIDRTFCDRMHLSLFLNVRIPANARYAAACERASLNRKQCSVTFECTSVVFERTCKACYKVACMRSIVLLALERTSASSINIPEAVCSVLISFCVD